MFILMHKEPFDLASTVLKHIITKGDPTIWKKEVLRYGIMITSLCMKAGVLLPPSVSTSLIPTMLPVNITSWKRSQGRSSQPKQSKRMRPISSTPENPSSPLDHLMAKMDCHWAENVWMPRRCARAQSLIFRTLWYLFSSSWIANPFVKKHALSLHF